MSVKRIRALAKADAAIRANPQQGAPVVAEQLKMPAAVSDQATKVLITAFSEHLVSSDSVYANKTKLRSLGGRAVSPVQIKATWNTRLLRKSTERLEEIAAQTTPNHNDRSKHCRK